jgi:hypothetical protein
MTVKELHTALAELMARDRYLADANVTFGKDFEPVEAGVLERQPATGLIVLNLAMFARG